MTTSTTIITDKAISETIDRLLARYPQHAARIERGAALLRAGAVRRLAEGRWSGTASDVVGEARGVSSGNALNWRYTLALDVDGTVWHVDFDDWMYLVDERTMLNRATMSKFGVRLGEVLLSFTKR